MDGLFGNKKSDSSSSPTSHTNTAGSGGGGTPNHKPSPTELLASAKVVADAAKSSFGGGDKSEVDKAKLAGAAEDLLNAAEEHGKLGESGYGKYLDKAEDYLHKYRSETGHDPPKTGTHSSGTGTGTGTGKESKSDEKHEGGGMGDAMKMAGNFFK